METATLPDLDCLDGMVLYGLSGDTKRYNACKTKLDLYLVEEAIKEFGLEQAISEKVITEDEAKEYLLRMG